MEGSYPQLERHVQSPGNQMLKYHCDSARSGIMLAVTHARTSFFLGGVHSEEVGSASSKSCTDEMVFQAKMATNARKFSSNPMIPKRFLGDLIFHEPKHLNSS